MSDVVVGQVWESEDPRDNGRRFQIYRVFGDTAWVFNIDSGRTGMIRIPRLRHQGKRGYRLVKKEGDAMSDKRTIIQKLEEYLSSLPPLPDTTAGWAILKCSVDIFCTMRIRRDILADITIPSDASKKLEEEAAP